MAREEGPRIEEKIIFPGGNIYSNCVKKKFDEPMNRALHQLYFNAYQNIINHIGLHNNIELGLHIKVFPTIPEYDDPANTDLYCRIETIPIVEQCRYLEIQPDIKPYTPFNRKGTIKERLKFLFKGEL